MSETKNPRKYRDSFNLESLYSKEWSKHSDIIDELGKINIIEDQFIPQLVAVGHLSSGKSSLLKDLTGIGFPTGGNLHTHFATQIDLRRADHDGHVRASIIPDVDANDTMKEKLMAFQRSITEAEFGPISFSRILDEAAFLMGFSKTGYAMRNRHFSNDILKIEFSGRDYPNLTIVDLPGLFHSTDRSQTNKERTLIRDLVQTYIADPHTIILAVMDGTIDSASQEVFHMAREFDPEGKRTIGIITKCDMVQPGDESAIIQIASNKVAKLRHGWFIVRNRSHEDIRIGVTIQERHAKEVEFFQRAPWNRLSPKNIGIEKLKAFLGLLLLERVQDEIGQSGILLKSSMSYLCSYKLRDTSKVDKSFFAYANDWKISLEDTLRRPVTFWPLSQPERKCNDGYTRLYWDCPCMKEMSIDIPLPLASLFQLSSKLYETKHYTIIPQTYETQENTNNKPTGYSSGFENVGQFGGSPQQRQKAPSQRDPGAVASGSGSSSRPASNNPNQSGGHSSSASAGNTSSGSGSSGTGSSGSSTNPQGHNQAVSIAGKLPDRFDIFFVVHCTDNRTVMKVINMIGTHKDSDLFRNIRRNYNLIRGWRRFFSFTTISDIQWVRFKRYSAKPVFNSDGLCDNIFESLPRVSDINYRIGCHEPPTPIIRPLSRQRIMELYEAPQDLESCNECLRTSMPKWIGRLQDLKESQLKAWGIYGVEGIALFKIFVWAFIINLIPIVGFAPWWLKSHPGDLQNAFVPSALVSMFYFGTVSIYLSARVGGLRQ